MSRHTPGHYKVCRYVNEGEFVTETCIRSDDESYLAKVGPVNIEANAALFAAAPDLLAALRYALRFCAPSADLSICHRAIDKAEGKR